MGLLDIKRRRLSLATAGLLLGLLAIGGCGTFGIWASKTIYPALTQPLDKEPAPTFLASTPSLQLSAWIGGQGGGLSCSIPAPVKPFFFSPNGNSSEVNLQFRQACAMHDLCYRHGSATYGYAQADCDFALVEAAFRSCVQIFAADKGGVAKLSSGEQLNATEKCRDQARQVLLGVRLGGGGSFKPAATSTYYEFDPIPDRAIDYSVVRWLGPAANRPSGHFASIRLAYGTGFYREMPGNWSRSFNYRFGFVPTPPILRTAKSGDELLTLARRSRRNTEVGAWLLQRKAKEIELSKLGTWDPDSSIVWVSDDAMEQRIVAWKRVRTDDAKSLPAIRSCVQSSKGCGSWKTSLVIGSRHDLYRTLQHAPLKGRFLSPHCVHIAILRRGGKPEPGSPFHDTGAGFENQLGVLFGSEPDAPIAPDCQSPAPRLLPIAEDFEPLGVIEMGETDAFIGFTSKDPAKPELPFSVRVFRASGNAVSTTIVFLDPITRRPLASGWIARSVAISKQSLLSDGKPHVVLTKVSAQTAPLPGVRVDALDYQIDPGACQATKCEATPVGGASCFIEEPEEETGGIIDPDLNRKLWMNGAAFPGLFMRSTYVSTPGQRLQIAVFKRGAPDQSFVVEPLPISAAPSPALAPHPLATPKKGTHIQCYRYGAILSHSARHEAR